MTGAAPFLCAVHPLRPDGKAPLSSGDHSTRVGAGTVTPVEVVDSGGAYSDFGQLAITGWAGYLADLGVGGIGTWFYDDEDEPDWIQSDDGWRIPWGESAAPTQGGNECCQAGDERECLAENARFFV